MSDLEDLMEDIKVYIEMEKEIHYDYWKVGVSDMGVVIVLIQIN